MGNRISSPSTAVESINVYLSHSDDPQDISAKEALVEAISAGVVGQEIKIIERTKAIPGEDVKNLDIPNITKAKVIVQLLSRSYLANCGEEIEYIRHLAIEKNKRVYAILARVCHFETNPSFLGRELLASKVEPILVRGKLIEANIANAAKQLLGTIEDYFLRDQRFSITFEELVNKLSCFLDEYNLKWSTNLLHSLIDNALLIKQLKQIENTYLEIFRAFSYKSVVVEEEKSERKLEEKLFEWKESLQKVKISVLRFIKQLTKHDLKKDWKSTYILEFSGQRPAQEQENYFTLFTPADKVIVPTEFEKAEVGQEYKRLFYTCQDALAVDQFEIAYKTALKIKEEVEPESAQLYEYLLRSYYDKEGGAEIIADSLNRPRGASKLMHLLLYAGRYKILAGNNACISPTGNINISRIANNLSEEIRKQYAYIEYDFISTESPIDEKDQTRVERCIETALVIYQYIADSTRFLEIGINELIGGGKFQWIQVSIDHSYRWQLEDVQHFNAVNYLKDIKTFLEISATHKQLEISQFKVFASSILSNLEYKYLQLRRAKAEKNITRGRLRKALIKCFHAFIVGFIIFDDTRFLVQPVRELKGEGELDWFHFNHQGKLMANRQSLKLGFDSYLHIKKMSEAFGGDEWSKVELTTIENTYLRYTEKIDRESDRLVALPDAYRSNEDRRLMIDLLRRRRIAFAVYGDHQQIVRSIEELMGDAAFIWFGFKNGKLADKDEIPESFDALSFLQDCLSYVEHYAFEDATIQIVRNIYEKEILPAYENINYRAEDQRSELTALVEKAHCCHQLSPAENYLNFIYEELARDKKLIWTKIKAGKLSNWDDFNTLGHLKYLGEKGGPNSKFSWARITEVIATRRYLDVIRRYERDIHLDWWKNNFFDRQLVIQLIQRCEDCFDLYPDPLFLEMPLKELKGGNRILWSKYSGIFRFFYPKELRDDFDPKKRLEELITKKFLRRDAPPPG